MLREAKVPSVVSTDSENIEIDGHLFFPAVVEFPSRQTRAEMSMEDLLIAEQFRSEIDSNHLIHLFPFGVAVIYEKHGISVNNLTEAAEWRRDQISRRRKAARDHLSTIGEEIRIVSQEPYCLTCLHLKTAPWSDWGRLNRAVQVLSCPSILLESGDTPRADFKATPHHEQIIMNQQSDIRGSFPFGFEDRHIGWASWSGVSIHFRDNWELNIDNVVRFEVLLQAIWTLADHVDQTGAAPSALSIDFFRRIKRRLRSIGSTEHTSERHMKEALIRTSRILDKIDNAIEALTE